MFPLKRFLLLNSINFLKYNLQFYISTEIYIFRDTSYLYFRMPQLLNSSYKELKKLFFPVEFYLSKSEHGVLLLSNE